MILTRCIELAWKCPASEARTHTEMTEAQQEKSVRLKTEGSHREAAAPSTGQFP